MLLFDPVYLRTDRSPEKNFFLNINTRTHVGMEFKIMLLLEDSMNPIFLM